MKKLTNEEKYDIFMENATKKEIDNILSMNSFSSFLSNSITKVNMKNYEERDMDEDNKERIRLINLKNETQTEIDKIYDKFFEKFLKNV